ncbi:hypothetical protein FAUST_3261 [Fusarium austroamericanum]|uniref:ADF-H domain-containing protein n=1 Tax=Fusarium austroamericanum TaxID=282268 RepID=A0AAN6HI26_FUSAU|nr:hypothetical protein FAUST_3261 [Fusarium austroamericanum]
MSGEETILARRARLSQVPRACEACKVRKAIQSDVTDPNPVAIVRLPVSLVNKPTPHNNQTVPDKTTGYHSCRYITPFLCGTDKDQREEYVASLEARLAKVEVRLDKQPTQSTPASTDPPTSTPAVSKQDTSVSPAVSSEPSVYDVAQTPVGNLYEGSSSFISQFQQASEEIKQSAAAKTPEGQQSISESFNQLHSMLHDSSSRKPPPRGPTRSMPDITPLPASVVLKIIRTIKVNPTRFFPGHAMTDIKLIEHLCQKVYFPTEPVTLGHITSVNGIMRLLLREFIITEDPLSKEHDLEALKAQVERNFHLGLETFETVTVPSFENVIAITTAVLKIQNESRPVLARTLVNAGLSHCQMLGYHREITYQKDQSGFAEHKRRLFWTLYVCDKTNSLHLGNASRMQDFEVDAQYPSIPVDVAEKPWIELFHLVIRLAKIQGLIFDKLYSVAALQTPAIERRQWIDTLVADAHQWRYDLDRLDGSQVRFIKLLELSMVHWDIMYYTTLTTLLRAPAMPGVSTDMTSQCFQTARLALESHLRAFSGYDGVKLFTKADYIDWALHNSSFTPFVVIFLHSMAASSLEDVQLLEQVVDTFRHAREIHAGAERLYQICATFARLARRMVESRNTSVGMYDQNTDSLQVAGVSQDVPLIWPEAFVQPTGQGQQATSDSDVDAFLNDDMTSILADWINGQPPATEMFVMGFGERKNSAALDLLSYDTFLLQTSKTRHDLLSTWSSDFQLSSTTSIDNSEYLLYHNGVCFRVHLISTPQAYQIVQYSYSNSVSVDQDCIIAANALRFSKGPDKIKFIIFKITDDEQNVVVEETSSETDYEVFRQKLLSGVDKTGNPAPRYAVYDVDYDLGEDGKRQLRMLYASTMEYLKRAVNAGVFTHAGNQEDIEWEELVKTGTDNTFQEFPYDLKKAVGKELPDCKVQSVVYPKYETSGELAQASEGFLGWLKERVMDIRKEKSEKPWPPHDRDVGVVLVAHSMGGFVAADSLFLAINERANDGDENDPLFPLIQGILTFDTPYNGLARSMFVYGAFSNYQKVNSVFNVMTAISAAAPASLARLSARRAATTAVTTTTRGPQWKTWQLVAVKTGTVGAIAAGGVAAYMNRELIMQGMKSVKNINKESVAEGYRQSMDAFGQGLAYINRGNVGRSFSWLSDHVTFVGALLRQKELNRRLERIGSLKGVGIHDFYCSLGENGYWSGGYFVPERTFCAIPEESHSAYPIFERCVMPKADDEVEAHMNMFRSEKHRGYKEMTERSAELVKKWFMSEDNVVDDPKFRETPPEETEETEKAKEILEKDPGAEENEKAEGADKDKDDEFPDESPLDIANAASLVPLPDDTGDQLIGDANIEGADTVEKRNYLNYLFGVAQSAGTDAKGWLPNKIPQMPNLPSMPNMPNMPKVPSSVSSLGNVSMPSMRIWGKKDGDTQGEGEMQDKDTAEEKNDTAEVETKAEPKETTDDNAEVAQKIEVEGEKKSG